MDGIGLSNSVALLINSVAIVLALVILVLVLWQEAGSALNLSFAFFVVSAMIWSGGALLSRSTAFVGAAGPLISFGIRMLEIGFTGACAGIYLFALNLTGGLGRRTNRIALFSVTGIAALQLVLAFTSGPPSFSVRPDGTLIYGFGTSAALIYLSLGGAAALLAWNRRSKLRGRAFLPGLLGFFLAILIELVSPEMRYRAVSVNLGALAMLLITYGMLRMQIIDPLSGRASQLQAVRDVGLAITSQLRLEEVLSAIAAQAAGILQANGALIFLNQNNALELAAVHNMSARFLGQHLALGEGLAGRTATLRQTQSVEDYRRDWNGAEDIPFARAGFGAVIAAPLIAADEVMGVLMVIEGVNGKRFDREDTRLLDLFGPQAAVAISNSRLFERQRALTDALTTAKNQLEGILTSTDNPVLALDPNFQVIFANPASSALFEDRQATSKSLLSIAPHDPTLQNLPAVMSTRADLTFETVIGDLTYLCRIGRLSGLQGYVAVLNDITDLKMLDRQKTQMIQMTSHNLKNPLFAAMSSFELLQDESEGLFSEQMQRDMRDLWAALQRMERIVHNILNLERVQSGGLDYEECSVQELVEAASRDLLAQAAKAGVIVDVTLPESLPMLFVSRQFMIEALANLIENAVKFTPEGGSIAVSATSVEGGIVITVADTGLGIPPEAMSRLFERFFRARQPGTERVGGSGLGLSLVKAVVDAHGGRIWVESEPGKGTLFSMALPIRPRLTESRR